MTLRRARPDPVLSDAVRRRLEALVAEIGPRRSLGETDRPLDPDAPESPAVGGVARRAWAFGREHLVVVAVFGLLAIAYSGFALTQARTLPVEGPTATPTVQYDAPTPVHTPEPRILVHVIGAVARPGVVELAPGARARDAVEAAGGLTSDARPGDLNLAAPVADGSQLVIGDSAAPGGHVRAGGEATGGAATGGTAVVDLNTATLAQLDTLPGVGPVTAQQILDWRERHGRFTRLGELAEVDGIGPKTLERLAPHVRV